MSAISIAVSESVRLNCNETFFCSSAIFSLIGPILLMISLLR